MGAREMLLTSAASNTEIPTEASASSVAERNAGVMSLRNRPVCTATRITPNGI